MDVSRQIEYWRQGSSSAFRSVPLLMESGFAPEALFWCHLGMEKALKAHVIRRSQSYAPKIHNLLRLYQLAELELQPDAVRILAKLNEYQLESRYPDDALPEISVELAEVLVKQAMELAEWLVRQL